MPCTAVVPASLGLSPEIICCCCEGLPELPFWGWQVNELLEHSLIRMQGRHSPEAEQILRALHPGLASTEQESVPVPGTRDDGLVANLLTSSFPASFSMEVLYRLGPCSSSLVDKGFRGLSETSWECLSSHG